MLRHMLDTHIVICVVKRGPPEVLEVFQPCCWTTG